MSIETDRIQLVQGSTAFLNGVIRSRLIAYDTDKGRIVYSPDGFSWVDTSVSSDGSMLLDNNGKILLSYLPDYVIQKASSEVVISAGPGLIGGGDLTQDREIALSTVGTPGTYPKVTTDQYGRVVSGSNLEASDLPSHNHNDLYFTEAETNALLAGKSDTGHTHAAVSLITAPISDAPPSDWPGSGMYGARVYNQGYPSNYGNVISVDGSGRNQIFLGWADINGGSAGVWIRNKRDNYDGWSPWQRLLDTVSDATSITSWNNAAASSHAHGNKTNLDAIDQNLNSASNPYWAAVQVGTSGVSFPVDAFGGSNDSAGIRLINKGDEAQSLEIYVTNDADDWLNIIVPDANAAKVNGYTIWNHGNFDPATKSDVGHTHDDRYYTEVEANSLLAGKSDVGHTHDDRYYTEAEITTALSSKSDVGHSHNDLYFTEAETINLVGGKLDRIPVNITQLNANTYNDNGLFVGYNVANAPNTLWGILRVWNAPGDSGDQVWQEWRTASYGDQSVWKRGSFDYGATWTVWIRNLDTASDSTLLANVHSHSNKSSLDSINQNLGTASTPVFASMTAGAVALQPNAAQIHDGTTMPSNWIGQAMANNDGWKIYGEGTDNAGRLVLEVSDDGDELVVIKTRMAYAPFTTNTYQIWHEGNFNPANKSDVGHTHSITNILDRASEYTDDNYDVGTAKMLRWKNHGDGHVIIDASQGLSPNGLTISNTDPSVVWSPSYPTLMGWNGNTSYGVRVDRSRYSDNADALNGMDSSRFVFGSNGSATTKIGGPFGDITKSGFYNNDGSNDSPTPNTWTHVIHSDYTANDSWAWQIAANFEAGNAEEYYTRIKAGNAWKPWRKLWTTKDISQATVDGWQLASANVHSHSNKINLDSINQNLGDTSSPAFYQLYINNGGNGQGIRIGDDVWIGDCNWPNVLQVKGAYDASKGYIRFGNDDNGIGFNGSYLTYTGPARFGANSHPAVPGIYNPFVFDVTNGGGWGGLKLANQSSTFSCALEFTTPSNSNGGWALQKRDEGLYGLPVGCFTIEDTTASVAIPRWPLTITPGDSGNILLNRNVDIYTGKKISLSKDVNPATGNDPWTEAPILINRSSTSPTDFANVASIGFHNGGVNASLFYYDPASSVFKYRRNGGGTTQTFWDSSNFNPSDKQNAIAKTVFEAVFASGTSTAGWCKLGTYIGNSMSRFSVVITGKAGWNDQNYASQAILHGGTNHIGSDFGQIAAGCKWNELYGTSQTASHLRLVRQPGYGPHTFDLYILQDANYVNWTVEVTHSSCAWTTGIAWQQADPGNGVNVFEAFCKTVWDSGNFDPATKSDTNHGHNVKDLGWSTEYYNDILNHDKNGVTDGNSGQNGIFGNWAYQFKMMHSNNPSAWQYLMAVDFFSDSVGFRRKHNGAWQDPRYFWHNGNLTQSSIDSWNNSAANAHSHNQSLGYGDSPTFAGLTVGNVSNTEIQHLDGVTANIQDQLDQTVKVITSVAAGTYLTASGTHHSVSIPGNTFTQTIPVQFKVTGAITVNYVGGTSTIDLSLNGTNIFSHSLTAAGDSANDTFEIDFTCRYAGSNYMEVHGLCKMANVIGTVQTPKMRVVAAGFTMAPSSACNFVVSSTISGTATASMTLAKVTKG